MLLTCVISSHSIAQEIVKLLQEKKLDGASEVVEKIAAAKAGQLSAYVANAAEGAAGRATAAPGVGDFVEFVLPADTLPPKPSDRAAFIINHIRNLARQYIC